MGSRDDEEADRWMEEEFESSKKKRTKKKTERRPLTPPFRPRIRLTPPPRLLETEEKEEESGGEEEADRWMQETVTKEKEKPKPLIRARPPLDIPRIGIRDEVEGDVDTPSNPYKNETPVGVAPCSKEKVIFLEETHRYHLQDSRGIYDHHLILSGSKVIDYIQAFRENWGDLDATMQFIKKEKSLGSRTSLEGNVDIFGQVVYAYFTHLFLSDEPLEHPLSYKERSTLMRKTCATKEFTYFISSATCHKIEGWVIATRGGEEEPCPFDLTDMDEYEAYQELQTFIRRTEVAMDTEGSEDPRLTTHPLYKGLFPRFLPSYPLDAEYIRAKYGEPSKYGTALHANLEHRLLGESEAECLERFPLQEAEDAVNINLFLKDYPAGWFAFVEYRVGSFRHKSCGSIDGVRIDPVTGIWTLYDWKRSNNIFDFNKVVRSALFPPERSNWMLRAMQVNIKFVLDKSTGFYHPVYSNISRSDIIYEYMVQLAVYRKLCILNGHSVSHLAYIVSMIPTVVGYRMIQLNLKRQCKPGAPSPILFVEWIFHLRETHVKEYYKKR